MLVQFNVYIKFHKHPDACRTVTYGFGIYIVDATNLLLKYFKKLKVKIKN